MHQQEELAAAQLELSEEELAIFKAAFEARVMRWRSITGFGHTPGNRIILSDRTYEVQKNGEYRRVA